MLSGRNDRFTESPPAATRRRILLIEDNPADARLVREWLAESQSGAVEVANVATLGEALRSVQAETYDAALLDLSLPDSHGLESLHRLKAAAPHLPIVVLSGLNDENLALQAVASGAQDYLVKGQGDGTSIKRALDYARARKQLEQALGESEQRFRDLVDKSHGLICTHDLAGKLLYANPASAASLGYTQEEIAGKNLRDLLVPEMRDLFGAYLEKIKTERTHRGAMQVQTKGGDSRLWSYDNNYCEEIGKAPYILGYAHDITELRRAQESLKASEERFRILASHAPIGIFMTGADTDCEYVNERWSQITCVPAGDAQGQGWLRILGPHIAEAWYAATAEGREFAMEFQYRREGIPPLWLYCAAAAVRNAAGRVSGYIGTLVDVTERKRAEETLRWQSLTDELTGLHNRRGFLAVAEHQLKLAQRAKRELTLFFVDLDGMKQINDVFGHAAGDEALIDVADVLRKTFRDSDFVARLGGDEFAVLMTETGAAGTPVVVERLGKNLTAHNARGARPYTLAFSTGAVHHDPASKIGLDALMAQADAAMYEQKRAKRKPPA